MAKRARCRGCARPAHIEKYPQHLELANKLHVARPITDPYQPSPEEIALDMKIAEEQRQEIWNKAWASWQRSLPEKFQDAGANHPKVLERLDRIAAGKNATAGMVIFGDVGEGKTWMAVGYANTAIQKHLFQPNEVLYGSEAELLASAANSAFKDVEPALRHLTQKRYKMVIIDDVGRGTWLKDEMRPKVFSLVLDAAWRDNRIVVVTTNLTNEALSEYIGTGAMDRLRAMSGYDGVVLADRDMRRKTTKELLN